MLIHYEPIPQKVGMPEDEPYKVLELLKEIEDEAANIKKKDYYFKQLCYSPVIATTQTD